MGHLIRGCGGGIMNHVIRLTGLVPRGEVLASAAQAQRSHRVGVTQEASVCSHQVYSNLYQSSESTNT